MRKEFLVAFLLAAAVLVSGCTQQPTEGPGEDDTGDEQRGEELEASAYDQIEQEMEKAIGDLALEGLEGELLI